MRVYIRAQSAGLRELRLHLRERITASAMSKCCGPSAALPPSNLSASNPFDCTYPASAVAAARHHALRASTGIEPADGHVRVEASVPVISDLDIYRSANILIKQHGEDAAIHAAMKADGLLAKGDAYGVAVWKAILRAIDDLQQNEPKDEERLH